MTPTKGWMTTVLLLAGGAVAVGVAACQTPDAEQRPPNQAAAAPEPQRPAPAGEPAPERTDAFGDPLPPGAIARMGTLRLRHNGPVWCVAYSPDGRFLAAGTAQGQLRLWDAETGKLVRKFVDSSGALFHAVAFSPDGALLASDKGKPGLWQVSTGKRLRGLENAGGLVACLAFSPDGQELALAAELDSEISLYDPATGKVARRVAGHEGGVLAVVFSKDGKTLASGGKDKAACIRDAATGKELHRFPMPDAVVDVALSPDGALLAARTVKEVRLWDVASEKEAHRFEDDGNELRSLAFSPDGKTLCSYGTVWDCATGKEVCRCKAQLMGGAAFSPDGKTVAAGGADHIVHIFDAATGKELPVSRDGWNGGIMREVAGFAPDGGWLAIQDGHICETTTGKEIRALSAEHDHTHHAALSPDGKALAGVGGANTIYLWETATGKELCRLEGHRKRGNEMRWALAFSPDSRSLATGDEDNVIRLWDVNTGKELQHFRGHESDVYFLFFTPDGKTLISCDENHATRFWDVENGKERREPVKLAGWVRAASPDGRLVAVRDENNRAIFLQEVATGRVVLLIAHVNANACVFSPDGRTLTAAPEFAAGPDTEEPVLLLETATGKVRARLTGHFGWFEAASFSPDGRMLATGSTDTTALVWDLTGRMRDGRLETAELSPDALKASWKTLASDDAEEAYRAIWSLASAPEQAVPLMKERMRPVPPADAKEIAGRIADLDSDDFAVREQAARELEGLGDLAEEALRKALEGQPPAELRRRAARLLERLDGPVTSSERLQQIRSLEVLEQIGTPPAEKVLEDVAHGAAESRWTREAKASLGRLSRRRAAAP